MRRIAPAAAERGAFLPAQPFGPAPLYSTGGLQRPLQAIASADGRGRHTHDRARPSGLPAVTGK